MGYYTNYEVTVEGDMNDEALDDLIKTSGYSWDGNELRDAKWYDWDNDLKSVSELYPSCKFTLNGVGEEYPDIWQATAVNGEVTQKTATISFD